MSNTGKPVLNQAHLDMLTAHFKEGEEFAEARRKALKVYLKAELPDRVAHLWRYTDPLWLMPEGGWELLGEKTPSLPAETFFETVITLRAGAEPQVKLSQDARDLGVAISPISQNCFGVEFLGKLVPATHGVFEALNLAAYNTGVAIIIPDRIALSGPIHIVTDANSAQTIPRVLVFVGRDSEATVIEEQRGGGEGRHVISVSELVLRPNAMVQYSKINNLEKGSRAHSTVRASLERDADLLTSLLAFGGSKSKLDIGATLAGVGARSEIVGVTLGEGRQHLDTHTVHDHRAANSWSNIDMKTALFGKAHAAYTGLIRIDKKGKGAEAYQENRNLLLSKTCKADTIPELEILTDDVRCTHGATIAPIDEQQVFYLKSRGISEREAVRLIVNGFMTSTIDRMADNIREMIIPMLTKRFEIIYGEIE
jgi:Fe-S cluster assembly protein SufD